MLATSLSQINEKGRLANAPFSLIRGLNSFIRSLIRGWPKHWGSWLLAGILAFFIYTFAGGNAVGPAILIANRTAFAVSCAGICLGLLGAFRHFVRKQRALLDSLNDNAFGIYLFHYPIVHWMQYMLVPLA